MTPQKQTVYLPTDNKDADFIVYLKDETFLIV